MKRIISSEYRKVEEMMDSRPQSKKQRHNDNLNYPADNVLLPSSPKRSPQPIPIEISGDESQTTTISNEGPGPPYRGTARQPPPAANRTKSNIPKFPKEGANPTRSPYFNEPEPRANNKVKQKVLTEESTREKSPGLAQKFVAADGTRRGSDVNASSDADELQSAPTTVGQNADPDAVFDVKDMRSKSPSKHSYSTMKAITQTDDLAILAPSTIKSDFPSFNAKGRNSGRPTRPAPHDHEAKPPWSVRLAAISLPEEFFKNDDLGLVHDRNQNEYYVQMRGSAIRTPHCSLQILPLKLQKILWEKTGTRVRLESSRSGTEDNVLDLEFASEHDVADLLHRLQESNHLSVVGKTRYVARVFELLSCTKSDLIQTVITCKRFSKRKDQSCAPYRVRQRAIDPKNWKYIPIADSITTLASNQTLRNLNEPAVSSKSLL